MPRLSSSQNVAFHRVSTEPDNGNVDILMLAVIMVVAVGIYGRPRKKP